MTDYSDYKVWTEVELYTEEVSLSEFEKYQPEDILDITSKLMAVAKEHGLQGCYLKFKSTMQPWEDYLGPVQITVCGYRKQNDQEKSQLKREEAVAALAKDKGITYHEASILMSLQERGKL